MNKCIFLARMESELMHLFIPDPSRKPPFPLSPELATPNLSRLVPEWLPPPGGYRKAGRCATVTSGARTGC